jgi:hypothetical protein
MVIYMLLQYFASTRFIEKETSGSNSGELPAAKPELRSIPVIRECCFPLQAAQYLLQCDQPHTHV